MQKICLIHTSVGSASEARELAAALIEQRLCACVQITGPGLSTYRWKGKVEQAEEYYLSIKTNLGCRSKVLDWLCRQHPYDLPEITWLRHDSSEQYAERVNSQVA